MKRHLVVLLLYACALSGTAGAATFDPAALHSFADTRYHHFTSQRLERSFHVYVRLPADYDAAATAAYPTVYLLDGGITFPLLASYYHYLALSGGMPALILVGISYGSDDFADGNMRSTDYTAPSAEREYWGGAAGFEAVLAKELIPFVEEHYQGDAARRIVFGQSLGGQFVLFTAQSERGPFWGHIASNPALHRNLPFFLRAVAPRETSATPRLFVASGSEDDPTFREPALAWMAHWNRRDQRPFALQTADLAGHSHFSAAPEAFRQGIAWLFSAD